EFRPRELRWQFAVTPPCLAMEVMKPFSPSFLWFKMYSLADPSGRKTALVAMRNSIYLIPLGILAYDCE
ncbi:protoheme IX farnesyltransferase mitochondrial-like, partial [Trifolium pratense]